jgi:hypothetical protein
MVISLCTEVIRETSGTLYPVPVRLLNYRSNGNLINKVSDPLEFTNNQLVRRFFQFDFASGVDDGVLKIIRAPAQFNFWCVLNTHESKYNT